MKNRHLLCLFLCMCMVVSLFSGFVCTASADNNVLDYTVIQGDYLFKICKANGLDYYQCKQAIMALNGFTSELQLNKISVGQKIKLPASNAIAATVKTSSSTTTTVTTTTSVNGTTTTTTSSSTVAGLPGTVGSVSNVSFYLVPHDVTSGETLNGICSALNTNYYTYSSMILAVNGITNAANIRAGKTVYIPSSTAVAGGYAVVEHTVKNGETLTSICSQYGVDYPSNAKLVSGLNTGKDMGRIYAGQTVYIPVSQASGVAGIPASTVPSVSTSAAQTYEISFDYNSSDPCAAPPFALVNNVNVSKAAAGSTVVINGNANTSKALESIEVTRGDNSIKTKYNGNSFVMPACNVKVKCIYIDAHAVIKKPATNGSYSVLVNGVPADYALKDDKITISVSPNSGYTVDTVKFNGSALSATPDGIYSAKMVASDVNVEVTFKTQPYNKLTWNSTVFDGSFTIQVNGTTLANETSVAPGQTVTVICAPKARFESKVTVTPASVDVKRNGETFTFKMPEADTNIDVVFYNNNVYSLKANSLTGGGTLRFSVNGKLQNVAVAGQTVTVMPEAEGTKDFDYAFVRFADLSATVPMTGLTFTMPAADVLVYGQFKDGYQKYTISQHKESQTNFSVCDSTNSDRLAFSTGEEVHVRPNFDDEKHRVSGVYWLDSAGAWQAATDNGGNDYSFTMPAYNVSVKAVLATYENWVTLTFTDYVIDADNGVRLHASINGNPIVSGTSVKNGSRIDLTAEVYGEAYFYGFTEDGVNDLVGTGTYSCYYIVSGKDSNITFKVRTS